MTRWGGRRLWRLGGGYGGWVTAVAVARRGLHAEGAEPDGAGVLRGAAGAGRGRPARQPDHPRHAHHGGGRQRHGHQVSRSKRKPVSRLNTWSTQKTSYVTRFNNYTDLRDVNAVNYNRKRFWRYLGTSLVMGASQQSHQCGVLLWYLGLRCSNCGEERAPIVHLPVSTLLKCQGDWLPCLSHLSLLKLSSSLKKNNKQQSRNALLLAVGEQMFNLNCEVNVVS